MKRFEAPIPGQSLTKTPGNYPWEKEPKLVDVDEVIKAHLTKISEEDSIDNLLFILESGLPVNILVETILTTAVSKGLHTVDVSLIVAPVIHEFVVDLATDAGVNFKEFFEDSSMTEQEKNRKADILIKKSLAATPDEEKDSGYDMLKELSGTTEAKAEEPVEEQPTKEQSKGLMSRGTQNG
tara:strand:+ start:1226 stop:1771 length:546 start_codon:yes stop_codon:yes gene_type:complete